MKILVRITVRIYRSIARTIRKFIVKSQVNKVGNNFRCDQDVTVYGGENITIGDEVVLNKGVILQSCEGAKIDISDNVTISYGVKIITGNLTTNSLKESTDRGHNSFSISIGDNVWIGANALLLPGVNIASNIIIAAGSVVSKSLEESNFLYAGIPAKKIKHL